MNKILKKYYPHLIALVIFVVVSIAYFLPQLQGKVVSASDFNQFIAMSHQTYEYQKETGEIALWTPSMFSGMPTFQLTAPQKNNLLQYVQKIMRLGFDRPIGYFIYGMICFYILMLALGVNPYLSIIGSILFSLTTGNLILYETGHITKINTIFSSPPIIAGVYLIFQNKYKIGGLLFSLFLGLNIMSNHPQMTYYLGMAVGIYFLIQVGILVKEKKYTDLGKQTLVLLVGCILALGASASKIWTTYEYGKSTMRGEPILSAQGSAPRSSSNTDGLEWSYAMNWSNGYVDLLPTYIPLAVGGSTQELIDDKAPLIKKYPNLKNQPLPLYWGGLTSTAGPFYFGALMFFLFIFGAFVYKGPLKWWLVAAVIFTFLLSLGKNFELLNRTLFDYFPLFNKFRTPNSVLSVTSIFIPVLAMLGLKSFIDTKDKSIFLKPLYISAGSLLAIALTVGFLGGSFFSFEGSYDAQLGGLINDIKETRAYYLQNSSFKTILFLLLGSVIIFLSIKGKIKSSYLILSIGLLTILDMWMVGKRYFNDSDFVNQRSIESNYELRPVDKQILADPDPHYRVFDVQNFTSALPSYHHKTIGGYHAAKLQRYQDIIDYHISNNNQNVLNMLNAKYFIFRDGNGQDQVQINPNALGNAWFVNGVQIVNSPNEEIEALNTIDPSATAVINSEFAGSDIESNFSAGGEINLVSYSPNRIVYNSNSGDEQLAVFSEVWYQPGWTAYIDGQPVDHMRVNYILRGMKVPAGQHEIVFEFSPRSYNMGEWLSLIFSFIIVLGVLYFIATFLKSFITPSK